MRRFLLSLVTITAISGGVVYFAGLNRTEDLVRSVFGETGAERAYRHATRELDALVAAQPQLEAILTEQIHDGEMLSAELGGLTARLAQYEVDLVGADRLVSVAAASGCESVDIGGLVLPVGEWSRSTRPALKSEFDTFAASVNPLKLAVETHALQTLELRRYLNECKSAIPCARGELALVRADLRLLKAQDLRNVVARISDTHTKLTALKEKAESLGKKDWRTVSLDDISTAKRLSDKLARTGQPVARQ